MPEHTEEERKRKLPFLARVGRNIGESSAASRERREALNRQSEESRARSRAQFNKGIEAIKTGARQFGAGFRGGNEGQPVDTSAFNPGEGTTDKTPRPPEAPEVQRPSAASELAERGIVNQSGEQFVTDEPFPGALDQAIGVRKADSDAAFAAEQERQNGRAPNLPPAPAPSLANAGREAVPAPPREGVPEGFINVIRGTQQSFLRDTGGPEFRQVPGQTLPESEQIAARRDPAFNVLTNEDLSRGRINATTLAAEAQKLQALFGNAQIGTNANNELVLAIPNASGGFDEISGFTPVIDGLVDQGGNFSISRVPGAGGVFESAVVLNEDTGETTNITNEQFLGKALTEYNNMIKRRGGGNLTIEQRLEILEEIEELMGDLPEIEASILSGQ